MTHVPDGRLSSDTGVGAEAHLSSCPDKPASSAAWEDLRRRLRENADAEI
jgi:anti-sigma factor RsiW